MYKKIVVVTAMLASVAALVYVTTPANALPVAANPQFIEKVESPCLKLSFAVNDGGVGYAEWALGSDAGMQKMQPGARYRVTSDQDVWLTFGGVSTPGTGIFLTAGVPEELSFSTKYDSVGTLYGVGATAAANVTLCRIKTSVGY